METGSHVDNWNKPFLTPSQTQMQLAMSFLWEEKHRRKGKKKNHHEKPLISYENDSLIT